MRHKQLELFCSALALSPSVYPPPPSPIEENISHGTVTITSLPTIYLVKTSSQSEDKLGTYMGPIKLKRKVCSNTHKLSLKLYRVML